MEKFPKYSFFLDYKDFIYKDISIEVLVPLVERLLKNNFNEVKINENSNQFLSKMGSNILKYNNLSTRYKKNFKK
jgi:hypothetical protein